jgi:hypothetical protein
MDLNSRNHARPRVLQPAAVTRPFRAKTTREILLLFASKFGVIFLPLSIFFIDGKPAPFSALRAAVKTHVLSSPMRLIFSKLRHKIAHLRSPAVFSCFFPMLALLLAGWTVLHANTANGESTDLLGIVTGELNREFSALKAKGDPPPYYMAYEVTDEETSTQSATLGALLSDSQTKVRGFDTTIRVGAPAFDNYHPYKDSRIQFTHFTLLSLGDDANQIKRALWEESDRVYRAASRRLLQLKTDQQLLADEKEKNADFSADPAVTYVHLPERYRIDGKAWAQRVRSWSGEFKNQDSGLGRELYRAARCAYVCEHRRLVDPIWRQSVPHRNACRGARARWHGTRRFRFDRSSRPSPSSRGRRGLGTGARAREEGR